MKKLISVLAITLILGLSGTSFSQGTKPKDSDKPKVYGVPKKAGPEPKVYGVPKKVEEPKKAESKEPKQKSYGPGPKADVPKIEPKKVYGPGVDKKIGPGKNPIVTPPKTGPPEKIGTKPKTDTKFDNAAAKQQKKEESKAKFIQATKPAPTYTDPKGKVHHIDEKDVRINHLRTQLTEERWRNRELRERQFYSTYYSRPVVVYHDPYNSFFWYWMLDRSIEQQAMWAYHHRQSMDAARYNDLMAKNAELAARVRQLESQGAPRDPTYVPHGMADNDLMYNQQYVQAAFNPVEQPVPQTKVESENSVLIYLFWITIILIVIALGVWLFFFKKW